MGGKISVVQVLREEISKIKVWRIFLDRRRVSKNRVVRADVYIVFFIFGFLFWIFWDGGGGVGGGFLFF